LKVSLLLISPFARIFTVCTADQTINI
jgi:hypothetical protein